MVSVAIREALNGKGDTHCLRLPILSGEGTPKLSTQVFWRSARVRKV